MPDLSKRIVYHIAGKERATVTRDLVYLRDGATELILNVYAPPGLSADARLPAVFFVHGGPIPQAMPAPTTWGIFQSYGELAAAAGLVGITFNHRLYGWSDHERSAAELAAAIDYVRGHADELHVAADRIALWAFSGGGPLFSAPLRDRRDYVRCLVAFYTILDLRHFTASAADAAQLARAQDLSVAAQLHGNGTDLPIFVARAGLDAAPINDGIDSFVNAALAANAPLMLANHPTGQHSFDALDDDDRSREIIGSAVAFVTSHLR